MNLVEGHLAIEPPKGVQVWDVDPYAPAILANPYPFYEELRRKGELVYIPKYAALAVGRYETTRSVFSDHQNFVSSRGVGMQDFKVDKPWRPPSIILEVDPPEHGRTRKVMAIVMSPKVVKDLGEMFGEAAERLVGNAIEKGDIDGVADLAEPFPVEVFTKAVGMKDVNARHLVDYGAMVFNAVGPDNELRRTSMEKAAEIVPWINKACSRERLYDEGLGAQIYSYVEAGDITSDEAALLVRSFLSAGVDTTVTGIGSALWCLSQNPQEWEKLKDDPSLARHTFEEVLRYTSPVHTFLRTAGCDTEIAGFPVKEGTKILCTLGAANMDPDKWDAPNEFRVDRNPRGHMAFGAGIHGCVGQNIARGELEAVLKALVKKVDRIEPISEAVWRPNNAIHALDKLPIRLVPK